MKKYFLLLLFLIALNVVHGQTRFQKSYGGTGNEQEGAIIETTDGGSIMVGSTDGGSSGFDVYVVKSDSNGTLLWTKAYGGKGVDAGSDISSTADGGYIITGYTDSAGVTRALLLKISKDGALQWTKSYGINYEYGQSVQQTSDKGYIVTGYTASFSSSLHMYVFKTDSVGALQWTKKISGGGCCGDGDSGSKIMQISDGGYVVLGSTWFWGTSTGVAYLAKISPNDTLQWENYYFNPGGASGYSFQRTTDKGFIIMGEVYNGTYLLKTDSTGASQWSKLYVWPGVSPYNWTGISVIQANDGGYALAGNSPIHNIFLFKTAPDGSLQWAKTYGDTNHVSISSSVLQNSDGGYLIGGYTNNFGAGSNDFYSIKTDTFGNSNCNELAVSITVTNFSFMSDGSTTKDTLGAALPVTFQLDSGGVETVFCDLIEDIIKNTLQKNRIDVFPNPFSISTTLNTNENLTNATFTMYSSNGQPVKEIKNIFGKTIILQRDNLLSGLYFLRLTQGNEIFATEKLVITDN